MVKDDFDNLLVCILGAAVVQIWGGCVWFANDDVEGSCSSDLVTNSVAGSSTDGRRLFLLLFLLFFLLLLFLLLFCFVVVAIFVVIVVVVAVFVVVIVVVVVFTGILAPFHFTKRVCSDFFQQILMKSSKHTQTTASWQ